LIDNEISARPAAGLARAKVVFEVLVEAGITRYLAFFDSTEEIKQIGPVRSARFYFLDWAEGFRSLLVHAGGSPKSLWQLALTRDNLLNLDEISADGRYFFRDRKLVAPHNLFTSADLLQTALAGKKKAKEWSDPELAFFYQQNGWLYKKEKAGLLLAGSNRLKEVKPIILNFSTFGYKVQYEYLPIENSYLRYLADQVDLTASRENIKVKNVIVIWLNTYSAGRGSSGRDKLRLGLDTLGEGQALVCSDGVCQPGFWRKTSAEVRIQFFDEDGHKIPLRPGNTWIEVLPTGREVVY